MSFFPFVDSLNLLPVSVGEQDYEESMLVKVKVINKEDGWLYFWTLEVFEERLEMMRQQIDDFFNYNIVHTGVD